LSPRVTLAVAVRVLEQLRRDPRTIGLVLAVPCLLMLIVKGAFEHQAGTFERVGPPMLGLFPLIIMFLITSVTMLRERTTGTLERLMTMPMAKLDLLAGYGIAFALVAAVQAAVTCAFAYLVLGLDTEGSPFWVGVLDIQMRCWGPRWVCCLAPSPAPSSRRCSSCRPSSFPRSFSVVCSFRESRWPRSST
jgi:ABC-type transport system involved in cytochrome c biogenesis permease component